MNKTVAFHTLGCKLNFAETSDLGRKFASEGYTVVDFKEHADVYVVNTCTVTAVAEKKGRTAIRQAIGNNPDAIIAVIGCFSQLRPEEIAKIEGVHYILGNADKHKLLDYLKTETRWPRYARHDTYHAEHEMIDVNQTKEFVLSYSSGDRTRSFLKVQDGCNYFCTYCAIPFARGRSRSANIEQVLKAANEIAQSGIKEIVLAGVNTGEFGKDHNQTFFQLLQELEKVNGIERYRISSIEPNLITDEIIDFVAESKKILPHFHIPLQSGSDVILKAMHRKYDRSLFAERIAYIKSKMPHACIAADVIVGFPGETEDVFQDAYQFIESIPISYLHVFTYSERDNTAALRLENKIPVSERRNYSRRLHELSEKKKVLFYNENLEKTFPVLWEADEENGQMFGFTSNYIKVKTPFNANKINQIEDVLLTEGNQVLVSE